jgi:hypothetical protein
MKQTNKAGIFSFGRGDAGELGIQNAKTIENLPLRIEGFPMGVPIRCIAAGGHCSACVVGNKAEKKNQKIKKINKKIKKQYISHFLFLFPFLFNVILHLYFFS